ncbi:hypothetical protein NVS55_04785 [Myxococcus stipitatus]|uniref:hypothetical protein n=1 Tax=Myxococcus stipitatus TaxID=83455 RepID=UPI0031456A8F
MSKVRWGVLGLAGAVVATAGVWSIWGETPREPAAPSALATPPRSAPADLEQEVRALRAELEALRRQQGALAQRPPTSVAEAPAREASDEKPPVSGEQARAAAEQARLERVKEIDAELEAAANTEPRDADWAGRTESLVTESFRAPSFTGSRLTRVECRTHLCTLEVEHDGHEARAELLSLLLKVPGIQGQAVLRPRNEGGRWSSRVYLSRAGEDLPFTRRP